ncbi:hypothetical protein ACX80E_14290 [Arthrobacter sp. TMN-49]
MDYVPAAMLWLLTAVRLPTALDKERASVLRATFFATIACTLFIPSVYAATDPLIGGHNHVGLVLILTILAGFWQFHTAMVLAAFNDEERRRHLLRWGRLAAAVAGTCVVAGFSLSKIDVTNRNLPLAYGDQPGMQLFLWTGSAFIIGVCVSVARTSLKFWPQMRSRTFQSGVGCFAIGCVFMVLALANRLALGLLEETSGHSNAIVSGLNWSFPAFESLAVILVSIGLMLPRYRESMQRLRLSIRSRWFMVLLMNLWLRSTTDRKYVLRNRWTPIFDPIKGKTAVHLHRCVVEVRDYQFRGMPLNPRERVLVNQAEQLLQGH